LKKQGFLYCRNGSLQKNTAFCIAEMALCKKIRLSALQKWLFAKKYGFLHCRNGSLQKNMAFCITEMAL
jgi:hypothetical protein